MASQPGSTEVRTYESIPIVHSGQVWMIVTCVLTIVIPSSLVVLRFIARSRFSSAPLDSSDYCIAAAMVSQSAHAIPPSQSTCGYGLTKAASWE